MAGQEAVAHHGSARSVLRKIIVTVVVGVISFPLTDLLFPELPAQIAMAAGFGAVVLLVQFLIDFEGRLGRVEWGQVECVAEVRETVAEGFAGVNDATRLLARIETSDLKADTVVQFVRNAAEIRNGLPPVAASFATWEIERLSTLLRDLAGHGATYDGEDRDWLLGLTGSATQSIDAVSIPAVDAAGRSVDGFWNSDLGRRFLELERVAVALRQVKARRVFVVENREMAIDANLRHICATHAELGILVRLLDLSDPAQLIRRSLTDFILFDDAISYEVVAAPHVGAEESPSIMTTELILDERRVEKRVEDYRAIWSAAMPWDSPQLSE